MSLRGVGIRPVRRAAPPGPGGNNAGALASLLTAVLAAGLLAGCVGDQDRQSLHRRAGSSPPRSTAATKLLADIDAERVYLLVGDDPLATDLWVLDPTGVHRQVLRPSPALYSMIDAAAWGVVLSAGGVGEGGGGTDGLYRVDGGHLLPFSLAHAHASPGAPALSGTGRLAFVATECGVDCGESGRASMSAVYVADQANNGTWQERQLACSSSSYGPLAWGPSGELVAIVTDVASPRGRLVLLDRTGSALPLGPASGATSLVWATGRQVALGAVPESLAGARGADRAWVVDVDSGTRAAIPVGWEPQAWDAKGKALLVSKGGRLGLWRPGDSAVQPTAVTAPHRVWDSAAVPRMH